MHLIVSKLFKELKNDIEILVGQAVLSNNESKQSKGCFNNSRTTWPT